VFPSLRPDRRSDVVLLEQWLTDTMRLLSAQFPARPASERAHEVLPLDSVGNIHVGALASRQYRLYWLKPFASAINRSDLSTLCLPLLFSSQGHDTSLHRTCELSTQAQEPEEMATAALWLYSVAFDELKWQVLFVSCCVLRSGGTTGRPPRFLARPENFPRYTR